MLEINKQQVRNVKLSMIKVPPLFGYFNFFEH